MKISRRRLMQIIKEEKARLIREQRIQPLPNWTHLEIIDDYLSEDGKLQLEFVMNADKEAWTQLTRLVSAYLRLRPLDPGGDYFGFREEMYELFGHIDAGGKAPGLEAAIQILKSSNAYPGPPGATEVDKALRDYEAVRDSADAEVAADAMAAGDAPPAAPIWSGIKTSSFE